MNALEVTVAATLTSPLVVLLHLEAMVVAVQVMEEGMEASALIAQLLYALLINVVIVTEEVPADLVTKVSKRNFQIQ